MYSEVRSKWSSRYATVLVQGKTVGKIFGCKMRVPLQHREAIRMEQMTISLTKL